MEVPDSERKRVRKNKTKKINPYAFYFLVFAGALCAGILFYEIFILFHRPWASGNKPPIQTDLSGSRND
jgi:hypothetical protein